ncbi:MAG TPA: hypothetical protein VGE35_02895 [Candidatus Paceibacterota bacterium]
MPLVSLHYRPENLPEELVKKLVIELTDIISSALDVPEDSSARLKQKDIEIRVSTPGPMDVNAQDLEIVVHAHEYPARAANIEERTGKIKESVYVFLRSNGLEPYDDFEGFIWVLLHKTGFAKIC